MISRVISALIAAALIIGVSVAFKAQGVYGLCSVVVAGCIYEYLKLTLKAGDAPLHIEISFVLFAFASYAATLLRPDFGLSIAVLSAIMLLSMFVVSVRKSGDLEQAFKLASAAALGIFYVGLFPGYVVGLVGFENGLALFFGLLGIVFAGDTFAYFFGRFLGKTKLLESVSPKKTIAGALGGLLGSAIVGLCLQHFFLTDVSPLQMVLIAIVSGAFGQIGDLFESLIKRLADVKDSGRIMPGHGGFLDRLDGVLFAAPVFSVLYHFLT